jgi:hypothetical protein
MTQQQLAEYRAMVGLQLQFAEQGDNHKVMEMQEHLERWIAVQIKNGVISSLVEMKATPLKEIICNLELVEVEHYRVIQANGLSFFCPDGFQGRKGVDEWKMFQVEMAEVYVTDLIERRLLEAVAPFLSMRVN